MRALLGGRGIVLGVVVVLILCCGLLAYFGGFADTLRGQPPGMLPPVQNTARPMTMNTLDFGNTVLALRAHSL